MSSLAVLGERFRRRRCSVVQGCLHEPSFLLDPPDAVGKVSELLLMPGAVAHGSATQSLEAGDLQAMIRVKAQLHHDGSPAVVLFAGTDCGADEAVGISGRTRRSRAGRRWSVT